MHVEMLGTGSTDTDATARCSYVQLNFAAVGIGLAGERDTMVASHCISRTARPFLPWYDRRGVMTGSNGNQLQFTYDAPEATSPAPLQVSTGTFTITGGTGRYRGATGGGAFSMHTDKSVATHWVSHVVLDGRIRQKATRP